MVVVAGEVHWHEGLFLRQEHLQSMQRFLLDGHAADRRLALPYSWGVVSSELADLDLVNRKVRFHKLHAVMPSGLAVNFPEAAFLPDLELSGVNAGEGRTVMLGVSNYERNRPNVAPSSNVVAQARRRWRLEDVEVSDDGAMDGRVCDPIRLPLRKVNAMLLLDDDPAIAGLETIPVLRVVVDESGRWTVPSEFLPPMLTLQPASRLVQELSEIARAMEGVRREITSRLVADGASASTVNPQFLLDMLYLRTYAAHSPRLYALLQAEGTHPLHLYLELAAIEGQLAALRPSAAEAPMEYRHEAPGASLWTMVKRIDRLIKRESTSNHWIAPFTSEGGGIWTLQLAAEQLEAKQYLLRLRTSAAAETVRNEVGNNTLFKLRPQLKILVPGFQLREAHPPSRMESTPDLHYFKVDRTARQKDWDLLRNDPDRTLRVDYRGGRFNPDAVELIGII